MPPRAAIKLNPLRASLFLSESQMSVPYLVGLMACSNWRKSTSLLRGSTIMCEEMLPHGNTHEFQEEEGWEATENGNTFLSSNKHRNPGLLPIFQLGHVAFVPRRDLLPRFYFIVRFISRATQLNSDRLSETFAISRGEMRIFLSLPSFI